MHVSIFSVSGEQEEAISHCHELEALVGRLEAVTTRLEEALSQADSQGLHEICLGKVNFTLIP